MPNEWWQEFGICSALVAALIYVVTAWRAEINDHKDTLNKLVTRLTETDRIVREALLHLGDERTLSQRLLSRHDTRDKDG